MSKRIEASFSLCDRWNPGLGYQVRIEDGMTGEVLLFSSIDPVTGNDLLTARACLDVLNAYVEPAREKEDESGTEKDAACALCQEIIPAGTPANQVGEYTNYTDDLLVLSIDLAHRDCAVDSGDRRWDYHREVKS